MHQNVSFFSKKLTFHFLHLFVALFALLYYKCTLKNDEQLRSHQNSLGKIVNVMPQAAAGLVAAGCLLGN